MLDKRGLIHKKYDTNKQVNTKNDIDPKYNAPRQVYSNPNKEADHVDLCPSIYKAALALEQNPGIIGMYNGKVWRKRYVIKVLTES